MIGAANALGIRMLLEYMLGATHESDHGLGAIGRTVMGRVTPDIGNDGGSDSLKK